MLQIRINDSNRTKRWRYGIPCVKIIGISPGDVTLISHLALDPLNADFDGDSAAIYRVHDVKAQKELERNAYSLHNITYDHNDSYLQKLNLEVYYSTYILLTSHVDNEQETKEYKDLYNLSDKYEDMININQPILLNGNIYPYGICLFNKWCNFKTIKVTSFISSNEIMNLIFQDSRSHIDFSNRTNSLTKKLLWFISTHPDETLTISLQEISELEINKDKQLLKKLPKNPFIGQHLYESINTRIYNSIPDSFKLKKLTKVKVRKEQLAKLIGCIGYIADDFNIINSEAITTSIFEGLNTNEFFKNAPGTRKGIVDKERATPESGYLERSMVVNLSPIELDLEDCGTSIGFTIRMINESHVKSLMNRWYSDKGEWKVYNPVNLKEEIGKKITFRSPITCSNPNFKICKKCFGKYRNIKTPYVGVLSGQYIAERLTQLSLRTFHHSGSCSLPTNKTINDILINHLFDIENENNHSTIILDKILDEKEIQEFKNINGYIDHSISLKGRSHIQYNNVYNIMNDDVTALIKNLMSLLKGSTGRITPIDDVYQTFIESILSTGQIYSTFVEIVLCNMYLVNEELLRYALQKNINVTPNKNLSIKKLHTKVSKLLGLLYEPNETTICKFSPKDTTKLNEYGDSVLERIWFDKLI